MVKQLVYRSRASLKITSDIVGDILTTARRNNMRHAITGLLLYGEGVFMQVIEGAPDSVDEVYGRIRQDWRHNDVRDLYTGYADSRAYPDWQMACRPLEGLPLGQDDVFTLATDILDQHERASPIDIGRFMKSFYQGVIPAPKPDRSRFN